MVHVRCAGDASEPAVVVARTENVWAPSARPVRLRGDVHAAQSAPSRRHSNVAAAVGELNAKEAVALLTVPLGPLSMLVSGGPSMVQLELAGVASTLPAASRARTSKVCEPAARPL